MNKQCIFNSNKTCDGCGECDKCDLNSNKKCTNCGKCLEIQGYDMKAIKIDEIIENTNDIDEFESEVKKTDNHSHVLQENRGHIEKPTKIPENEKVEKITDDIYEETYYNLENEEFEKIDDNIEFIDDIDGLRELIEGEESEELKDLAYEEFPGFIRIKGSHR